jgi:hypothetical protein
MVKQPSSNTLEPPSFIAEVIQKARAGTLPDSDWVRCYSPTQRNTSSLAKGWACDPLLNSLKSEEHVEICTLKAERVAPG